MSRVWRKATFSEASGNSACVEVAREPSLTAIRDSKNPDGSMLTFSESGWRALRSVIK